MSSDIKTGGSPSNPWPTVFGATLATIPTTMDGLMTNQAYGNIMGGLGADPSTVTWVNTAIYTAEALGLPMAAFFATVASQARRRPRARRASH